MEAEFHRKALGSFSETIYPYQYKRRNGGHKNGHGGTSTHKATRDEEAMNDVADGLLLDVREISITDLEFADIDSALNQALERILFSRPESNFPGFNNFIS